MFGNKKEEQNTQVVTDPNAAVVDTKVETPAAITKEDLTVALGGIADTIKAGITEAMKPAPVAPKPVVEEPVRDVSDADYYTAQAAARENGDYSKVQEMETVRRAAVEERGYRRAKADFQPHLVRNEQALGQLSDAVTKGDMPYYDALKTELDTAFAQVPPENLMQPNVKKFVYEQVVGKNMPKILEIEKEKMLRSQDPNAAAGGPGEVTPRQDAGTLKEGETPDIKDIYSEDARKALANVGRSFDDLAKARGYKDGATYYKEVVKPYQDSIAFD